MIPILITATDKKIIEPCIREIFKSEGCRYPPVFVFNKQNEVVTIDQIREIKSLIRKYSGVKDISIVINDFETAKVEAQNAFLKTLEESGKDVLIILTASNSRSILPTVLSRCRHIKLNYGNKGSYAFIDFRKGLAELFSEFAHVGKNRDLAISICDQIIQTVRKDPSGQNYYFLRQVLKTRSAIEKNNLNPQLGVDHLLIILKKGIV